MATSSTSWAWHKAASAAMPAGVLGKDAEAPLRPMRAARDTDAISTPQITWVTVTFLVSAIESLATVRSCVTGAAVPGLSDGEPSPQDEREPSARGGTDASVPPPATASSICCRCFQRYKDDGICWKSKCKSPARGGAFPNPGNGITLQRQ